MRSFRAGIPGKIELDSGPRLAFAPPMSDTVNALVFTAAGSRKIAVPADAVFVLFSSNVDFFAKMGDIDVTAAVPNADVTNGSAAAMNPSSRLIPAGVTHIAVAVAAVGIVTAEFYGS